MVSSQIDVDDVRSKYNERDGWKGCVEISVPDALNDIGSLLGNRIRRAL